MRNIQRPAHRDTKAVLAIAGLGFRLAIERVRLGVERGAAVVEEDGAVRLVHVKAAKAASASAHAAAHHHHHGSATAKAAAPAAKTSSTANHLDVGSGSAQGD